MPSGKGRHLLHCRWWLCGGQVIFLGSPGHHYSKVDGIHFAECHAITSLHGFAPMKLRHMVAIAFGLFQLFIPSGVDSVPLRCFLMLLASLVACHDVVRLVVFWSSVRDGVWVMTRLYGSAGSVLLYHTILHAPHQFWSKCYLMPWTQSRFLWFIPTWKTFSPLIFIFLFDAPCGVSTRSQSCPRFQCVPYVAIVV